MKAKVFAIVVALVLVFLSNMVSNLKEAAIEREAESAQVAVTMDLNA